MQVQWPKLEKYDAADPEPHGMQMSFGPRKETSLYIYISTGRNPPSDSWRIPWRWRYGDKGEQYV